MTNKIYTLISWISIFIILMIYTWVPLHPILSITLLIIYNSILCMNMSTWKSTHLFSILFFLIMISGLLIIFLYFASLISNEKASMNPNKIYLILTNLFTWTIFILMTNFLHLSPPIMLMLPLYSSPDLMYLPTPIYTYDYSTPSPIYNSPLLYLTLLNMTFLLLALFLTMKLCSPKSKSMRKMN